MGQLLSVREVAPVPGFYCGVGRPHRRDGGEVMPAIHELRKLHLADCNELRPDPVALALRLYGFPMHGRDILHGDDVEAMWDAFSEVNVDVGVWEPVVDVRGKAHHEEAIVRDKRLLPHRVDAGARCSHYGGAFAIVKKSGSLRVAHKQLGMFRDEQAEIRREWKRKRNFMKLLDAL